ncbi:MAG: HNH endonuclease signature motif containing protein [Candidatus Andersenbacteria bacterium]
MPILHTPGKTRKRSWTEQQLRLAVKTSRSYRQVLNKLNLIAAGGNYDQIKKYVLEFGLSTKHFSGRLWSKGCKLGTKPLIPLSKILRQNVHYQSYKLKKRLIAAGLKSPWCEECGWARRSSTGYLPLELDHINGDRHDNRLENLRILCPNCHSLKPTHRGRNKKSGPGGATG